MTSVVAIVSGGLDSTTLLYDVVDQYEGKRVHALSFDYGQKHVVELDYAKRSCEKLGVRHDIVDLSGITDLISNSSLTSDQEVPEGHYAEDNMKQTVVPNRNMIMLSIAAGVAVNENANFLAIGVHAGDHFVYPDCRPAFIMSLDYVIKLANQGFGPFEYWEPGHAQMRSWIYAPYLNKSKADIAYKALELGVPLEETWSCYKGGDIHCGKCGTCVERLEAIHEASVRYLVELGHTQEAATEDAYRGRYDETEYEDSEFWKEAVKNARS